MQPTKEKLIKTLLNKRELWNGYSFSCYKKNKIINLKYANLKDANLYNANLKYANLYNANLEWKQLSDYQKSIFKILSEGDIFGYKKILSEKGELIIKIKIPKQAKRLNALSSRKCRAEYAIFDSIVIGDKTVQEAYSGHDNNFKYILKKGFKIIPDSFDEKNKECSNGIHFFITQVEAEKY